MTPAKKNESDNVETETETETTPPPDFATMNETSETEPSPSSTNETESENETSETSETEPSSSSMNETEPENVIPSASEISDARLRADEKRQAKRQEEFLKADPLTKAVLTDGNSIDRMTIVESFEKDQYVRDGNVLYPAPLERPAGANPSFVNEVVEAVVNERNDVRVRSDEAAGLDPHAREDVEV